MSILNEMEQSLISDAPSYIEFLYRYDPKKKQAFAFFEGDEDAGFYHNILIKYIDSDCELEEIIAGGKDNVLKLHREFNWDSYNKKQILFFVDRDLSYWLDDPADYGENVFVTDDYSVENYVVNVEGFKCWILRFEGFARAKKQEIENMLNQYAVLENQFKEKMKHIMAMAVVAKRHDKNIKLCHYKLSKCLNFQIQNDQVVFTLANDNSIISKWRLGDGYEEEVKHQMECFSKEKHHYSVRGKWALLFMAQLGEFMRLNAEYFAPSLCKCNMISSISPTCAVPPTQCLSVLAPYYVSTNTPKRLEEFLKHTYYSIFKKAS